MILSSAPLTGPYESGPFFSLCVGFPTLAGGALEVSSIAIGLFEELAFDPLRNDLGSMLCSSRADTKSRTDNADEAGVEVDELFFVITGPAALAFTDFDPVGPVTVRRFLKTAFLPTDAVLPVRAAVVSPTLPPP